MLFSSGCIHLVGVQYLISSVNIILAACVPENLETKSRIG